MSAVSGNDPFGWKNFRKQSIASREAVSIPKSQVYLYRAICISNVLVLQPAPKAVCVVVCFSGSRIPGPQSACIADFLDEVILSNVRRKKHQPV